MIESPIGGLARDAAASSIFRETSARVSYNNACGNWLQQLQDEQQQGLFAGVIAAVQRWCHP
jgi:hypothetical protein